MDYRTTKGEIVTVQQGFWFSAHEQWKVWSAPYLSNARVRAVFENCERVRSIYSAEKGIPGLRASVRGQKPQTNHPSPNENSSYPNPNPNHICNPSPNHLPCVRVLPVQRHLNLA